MKLAAGAEAAEEVGIGPLPKTTRRRGSQTQSISVRLAAYCWSPASVLTALYEKKERESALHGIKNTPNCQRAQPTQRSEAICHSIFGAVCLPAAE